MDISHRLRYVGPKREMKSIWTDILEEAVGPKDEMWSIWYDR